MEQDQEVSTFWPRGTAAKIRAAADVPFADEPIEIEWIDQADPGAGIRFFWKGMEGWLVRGLATTDATGLVLSEVAIRRDPNSHGAGGVTSKALRGVPTGFLLQVVRERLRHIAVEDHARAVMGVTRRPAAEVEVASGARDGGAARGRPPLDEDHFRLVAELLLDELTKGPARGATTRLATRLSEAIDRLVTEAQAKTWVGRARNEFHFLGPTRQGRPGAEPGPRLIESTKEQS